MCALCAVVAIKITTYRYMYCFRPVFTVLQTFQKWTVPVFCLQGPVSLEAPAKLTKGLPLRPALIESWTCWKSLHQVPVTWGNSMLLVQETHPETFFYLFLSSFLCCGTTVGTTVLCFYSKSQMHLQGESLPCVCRSVACRFRRSDQIVVEHRWASS